MPDISVCNYNTPGITALFTGLPGVPGGVVSAQDTQVSAVLRATREALASRR